MKWSGRPPRLVDTPLSPDDIELVINTPAELVPVARPSNKPRSNRSSNKPGKFNKLINRRN